jgi:hypothetical protein
MHYLITQYPFHVYKEIKKIFKLKARVLAVAEYQDPKHISRSEFGKAYPVALLPEKLYKRILDEFKGNLWPNVILEISNLEPFDQIKLQLWLKEYQDKGFILMDENLKAVIQDDQPE